MIVGLVLSSAKLQAQPDGTARTNVVRPISLEESIRLTLERNLGLQIQRLSPQIARFNLAGSYGYYDPVLSFNGGQSFRSSPGGFDPATGLPIRSRDTWTEDERDAFGHLSLLVAQIPSLTRWPRADRRALALLMRAKGGSSEREYAHRLDCHTRLRRALEGLRP